MKIRVSAGTAMNLDLKKGKSLEEPTTAYVMIPGDKCRGGCPYCPQANGDAKWLSRVSWPEYDLDKVIGKIKKSDLDRICLQSPDIEGYEDKIKDTVFQMEDIGKPISLSSPPLSKDTLEVLNGSVERIGIGLDSVTDKIREKVKPKYDPKVFWEYIGRAADIYGEENVTVHFIVGMGETLEELATAVKKVNSLGSKISLFSYLYKDDAPDIEYYRKAQVLKYMIEDEGRDIGEAFDILKNKLDKLEDIIGDGQMFKTQGCPGCNRPFYTTKPGEEHRNFPRKPNEKELMKIKEDLGII